MIKKISPESKVGFPPIWLTYGANKRQSEFAQKPTEHTLPAQLPVMSSNRTTTLQKKRGLEDLWEDEEIQPRVDAKRFRVKDHGDTCPGGCQGEILVSETRAARVIATKGENKKARDGEENAALNSRLGACSGGLKLNQLAGQT